MKLANKILYYIHDPMCSWCWAFKPTWNKVKEEMPRNIEIQYLLGGLAPDTDKPMQSDIKEHIRGNWEKIQENVPGIKFNYDFWTLNTPKRSTYPACRAVICAKNQGPEYEDLMIEGIQYDYYLNAKNPSNNDVLINIAKRVGLEKEKFKTDLKSEVINETLSIEIEKSKSMSISSFPSLVLVGEGYYKKIQIDYLDHNYIINQIIA